MIGTVVGFGAGVAGIVALFRATRLRGAASKPVQTTSEPKAALTEAADATCALSLCAIERFLASVHPVTGSTPGVIEAAVVLGVLATVGAVWAADATVKILGPLGLVAFLATTFMPVNLDRSKALLALASAFLVACRLLRRCVH
jgi:hypothetical protein